MLFIQCLTDTDAEPGFVPEFGLSLLIQTDGHTILFDTGAGASLLPNAARAGIDLDTVTALILSHGHYDHTGGLAGLSDLTQRIPVYAGRSITAPCWSLHDDGTKHRITMPRASQDVFVQCNVRVIDSFREIDPGIFLTGPIPRESGEDCGGHFFSDEACTIPNTVPEETALLLRPGVLVTGCCHAGIVNSVEACRKAHPEIPVRVIVGGLHLRHADEARLAKTADCLNGLGLERIIPMHCTGADAVRYLRDHLKCEVCALPAGRAMQVDMNL